MKPTCYDLFTGLHGWLEAFLAEGYRCVGYDIVDMCAEIGHPRPDGIELRIRDVRSIHGSELKDATVIVASPPCQEPSYRAMPWKRAKALNAIGPPHNFIDLFNQCFRIQREASEAAGRYIPLIVENVCGAQQWVGRARWHYGSFYLWGDVPALMPIARRVQKFNPDGSNHGPGSWFAIADSKNRGSGSWFNVAHNTTSGKGQNPDGRKTVGHRNKRDGHAHTGTKFSQSGDAWFDGKPRDKMLGDNGPAAYGSKSISRKAASAMIAKIPEPLARHIARAYKAK